MDSEAFGDLVDTPRGKSLFGTRTLPTETPSPPTPTTSPFEQRRSSEHLDEKIDSLARRLDENNEETHKQSDRCDDVLDRVAALKQHVSNNADSLSSAHTKLDDLLALSRRIDAGVHQYIESLNATDSEPAPEQLAAATHTGPPSLADTELVRQLRRDVDRLEARLDKLEKSGDAAVLNKLVENVSKLFFYVYSQDKGKPLRIKGGMLANGLLHISLRKVTECQTESVDDHELPPLPSNLGLDQPLEDTIDRLTADTVDTADNETNTDSNRLTQSVTR